MGRDGDQTATGDQQREPLLESRESPEPSRPSSRERAVRGRPGERSRAALADLAVETEKTLAADVAALDPDADPDASEPAASATTPSARDALGLCVDAVVGARRLAGWTVWLELLAVARLLAAWTGRPPISDAGDPEDPVDPDADPALSRRLWAVVDDLNVFVPVGERLDTAGLSDALVAAEVAAAAAMSKSGGDQRVRAAATVFLSGRLPRTRLLLRAGMLTDAKLTAVLQGTAKVEDDEICRLVEARLIPDPDLALARAAGMPEHVLDVLDPASNPKGPGSVWPWLARATIPVVKARIEKLIALLDEQAASERAEKAKAKRHVRAEALPDAMGAITVEAGRDAVTAIIGDLDACVASAKAAGDPRTPGQIRADELVHRMSLGAYGSPALPTGACGTGAGARALKVSLTMPLATWLGLAAEPGVLDGYGPIPAALARQIAADAAGDHPTTTTWRCIPLDDAHRTVLGVGDTIPTPRHDPTNRQRDLVTTADASCVWPGCGRRSVGCDVDHRIPYEAGGPTCPCNLQALCRTHHRLKGAGVVGPEALGRGTDVPVGSTDWTTWTGRTYRYTPEPAAEPPVTADEHLVVYGARLRRVLDDAGTWADPDDPRNDTPSARLRSRLRDMAAGFRLAGPADEDPTVSETITGLESWQYAVRRYDRRFERDTRDAERRAAHSRLADRADLAGDLDDECPF